MNGERIERGRILNHGDTLGESHKVFALNSPVIRTNSTRGGAVIIDGQTGSEAGLEIKL